MTRELIERDMQIKLLSEKLRSRESEKKLRVEHADLLCSVSDLILKFLQRLDGKADGNLREEIEVLQERASRLSAPRFNTRYG
jgi:hypothetical protein